MKKTLTSLALGAVMMTASAATDIPRYVFLYIGDGMGMGPVMATQNYRRTIQNDSTPLPMLSMPVVGWCQTYSASSHITDSAAAGTALATGTKTKNGMLGMAPDTTAVNSVARILKDTEGYGVGIVTSVAADDATPGAFYAHVPYRKMYASIDSAAALCGYEIIAGAGLQGTKDNGVMDLMAQNGVQFVRGPQEIASIDSRRVVLLNPEGSAPWNVGYTIDSIPGVLTLPQIVETSLAHLNSTSPDRFFLMVEGGNIDHALHANDGGAAVKEIENFNRALLPALEFYAAHPDETLIVVTADHDTGGMAINNTSKTYTERLGYYEHQRISKERFNEFCKEILAAEKAMTWPEMQEILKDKFGFYTYVPVPEDVDNRLHEIFDATFRYRNGESQETLYATFDGFVVEVFKHLSYAAGVGFTTTSHSGNPVPLCAIGVGADRFKGLNNNCEVPVKILELVQGK